MAGQTRIDGNLIDTGTDPNDIVSVSVGDARYPRLSEDNTLAGNLTVDGQVRSDNVTDSAGSGAPAFPNGMSATGAALTDPEITGGIYLGGTGAANYLDDYEEGTWTPILEIGANSVTYNQNSGFYTKIGRSITAVVFMTFSAINGDNNAIQISLPFTANSESPKQCIGSILIDNLTSARDSTAVQVGDNSTTVTGLEFTNGGTVSHGGLTGDKLTTSSTVRITVTYDAN